MNIVEVGGNIGNHTIYFSAICDAKSVLVFEPNEPAFNILQKNVALNGCKNVKLVRAGVAERSGRGSVSASDQQNLGGTMVDFDDNGEFPLVSLDDVIDLKADFIKIDVEGMALGVLRGAHKFLDQNKAVIMIELWDAEIEPAKNFLSSIGYFVDKVYGADYIFVKS